MVSSAACTSMPWSSALKLSFTWGNGLACNRREVKALKGQSACSLSRVASPVSFSSGVTMGARSLGSTSDGWVVVIVDEAFCLISVEGIVKPRSVSCTVGSAAINALFSVGWLSTCVG